MRRFFVCSCLALVSSSFASTNASACDRYLVSRPVTTTQVVYRTVPVATYAPVVYSVSKPVVEVQQAVVAVAHTQPAKVAIVTEQLTRVQSGSTLNVRALFLGKETGVIFLKHAGVTQRCVIHSWEAENATFTLPAMDISREIDASIEVIRPNGELAKRIEVRLAAPSALVQVVTPASSQSEIEFHDEAPAAAATVTLSSVSIN